MPRRILIPLGPSPYTNAAIDFGCYIADRNDDELTGLVILDIPGIKKSVGATGVGGIHYARQLEKAREAEARKRIDELMKRFKKKCEAAGVRYHEAIDQGSPLTRILHDSMYYDAIVTGLKTYFNYGARSGQGKSLVKVLGDSICPIIGVPRTFSADDLGRDELQVLIAFDGSPAAARALHGFANLARRTSNEVLLVMSHADKEAAVYELKKAERYLRAHEFENVRIERTAKDLRDAFERKYYDWADLIVVGAHAKMSFMDFKVGSLTTWVIEADRKPVLIG